MRPLPHPAPVSASGPPAAAAPLVLALASLAVACQPPPPAPEGLDASSTYMIREFYSNDAYFEAGVVGFLRWYRDEGYLLVGEEATGDNTDAFTVTDLSADDVAQLPLDELEGGRDLSLAKGVVSLAEMDCTWKEAERILIRSDQHVVFSDNFEGYEREYVSSRQTFEGAEEPGSFAGIGEDLDRFAEDFDPTPYETSLLLTVNQVDPASLLGVDLPPYTMYLDARHGIYDIDGEEMPVFAIITFVPGETYNEAGDSGLRQTYSIELNVGISADTTLRVFAAWAEPISPLFASDSALVLNYAVNTSLQASERMSDICAGRIEIPAE